MSTTYLEIFGDRLRFIREKRKLTQTQLGERLGITQGAIAHLENGKRQATKPLISSISRELSIKEDWLKSGFGEMDEESIEFNIPQTALQMVESRVEKSGFVVHPNEHETLVKEVSTKLTSLCDEIDNSLKESFETEKAEEKTKLETKINANNFFQGDFRNVGDIVGGNKIVTEKHTTKVLNQTPEGSISEAQARQIQEYLTKIGTLETERVGKAAYGMVQNQFKKRFAITSYKNLPEMKFNEAIDYLEKREKIVEKSLLKEGKNPISRNDFIRRIQTICKKELGWTDVFRKERLMKRIGKSSLSDLTMYELEDFYKYILSVKPTK